MSLLEEHSKVKALLTEAVTVLCKKVLSYQQEFKIEGLLGITLDSQNVLLVNICEEVKQDVMDSTNNEVKAEPEPNMSGRQQGKAKKRKRAFLSGYSRETEHTNNVANGASVTYNPGTELPQTKRMNCNGPSDYFRGEHQVPAESELKKKSFAQRTYGKWLF